MIFITLHSFQLQFDFICTLINDVYLYPYFHFIFMFIFFHFSLIFMSFPCSFVFPFPIFILFHIIQFIFILGLSHLFYLYFHFILIFTWEGFLCNHSGRVGTCGGGLGCAAPRTVHSLRNCRYVGRISVQSQWEGRHVCGGGG